jgi:riboflavin synthase
MFTGLISDVGTIVERTITPAGGRFTIRSAYEAATIAIGASICCDGCCLTALEPMALAGGGSTFKVDVSNESLAMTTLGTWGEDRRINMERSLKAGDELGGHIVSGHVDGVALITNVRQDGDSTRFTFEVAPPLHRMIAPKGSVALDGTSLTINEVANLPTGGATFGVNIIPHTQAVTTWGGRKAGERVNLEVDVLARYVARLLETR